MVGPPSKYTSCLVLVALLVAGCAVPREPTFLQTDPLLLEGIYGPDTDEVLIVVHAHPGREPAPATVAAVLEQVERLVDKPTQLEVRERHSPFPDDHRWTHADRQPLVKEALAEPWPERVALLHLYSMPGCVAYNQTRPCIGGVAGSVAWVFTDASEQTNSPRDPLLRDLPLIGWYATERFLYVHELGHVLGLVGRIPQVEDRLHREGSSSHGTEERSVMYRAHRSFVMPDGDELVETFLLDNFYLYTFSGMDIADARAYRNSLS